jgi:PLP dependent protein
LALRRIDFHLSVKENASKIKEKIDAACRRSGRNPEDIHIIAVTKYVSVDRAKEALDAGIVHLGENRDDGFLEKWEAIGNQAVWHFIGTLQSRKVKNIIDKVHYIHSLDRISLAKEIQKRASKPIPCFVQVNVSGEESKHGIQPGEVISFVEALAQFPLIKVIGLMTMAPYTDNEALIRSCFRELKNLQQDVQALQLSHAPCNELSMGMSNDFEIAIEEGATFIRLGTSLVGNE